MPDDKTFDVRTLERKLRRGLISRKDYEKYLKTLADRSDNAAKLSSTEADGEDDDEEDEGDGDSA